jgi:hypothetical protein
MSHFLSEKNELDMGVALNAIASTASLEQASNAQGWRRAMPEGTR